MPRLSPLVRQQRAEALAAVASIGRQVAADTEALTAAMSHANSVGCSWHEIARHAPVNRATAQRRVKRWQQTPNTTERQP
ncbi:hypothetical protein [Candidatus Poriferisocius sp.]|uniref:hypothetical protein n=1 Tax=Candidatus Poriferisocius sp. TaxID=3101276 RepID=UPI003B01E56A